MKVVRSILVVVAFLFATSIVSAQDKKENAKEEQVVFFFFFHCENCENRIKKNIPFEKGVKDLTTDLSKQLVTITYKTDKTDSDKLKKSIEKLGYICKEMKEK
ncbi:MAG: heavy-metal-associated domain-containing protein [Chitinispirillales bacterium]|jgi:copper chaperone CopZ|nr:heavy-metal-associated domain-containing protein [Chitinispirillales bacterium]